MREGGGREIKDGSVVSMEQSGRGNVYLLNRFVFGSHRYRLSDRRGTIGLYRHRNAFP